MKNSIKITQDAYDKNVLHMELGGTSGNPENPEKVVVINTLEDGEITRANREIDKVEYKEPTMIYCDNDSNDLIKVVDYKNHIALLVKLNKIKRVQLEVNGKQLDIKSSPIAENNKDYVIQIRRDGNDWKENLCVDGLLTIRTGQKSFMGLVEKTQKLQITKRPNSPVFMLDV